MPNDLVLVTGGSGFLGSHCLLAAVNAGYKVRTTVRSLNKAEDVRQMLRVGGASEANIASVDFVAADLTSDDGWTAACKDCTYVLHTASPFPGAPPEDEEKELIAPAVNGTMRVLKAAKAAGTVKRIVLTASTACITFGHPDSRLSEGPFTEEDYTNLENPATPVPAYARSKALAERAAWDYIRSSDGAGMELSTIHPCGIYGPILSKSYSTSVSLIEWLMNGSIPMIPQLGFGVVDARDVASLHLLAMTSPRAAGERFLAVGDEYIDAPTVGRMLREEMGEKARKVPTWTAPNLLLKFVGLFDRQMGGLSGDLGKVKVESNAKAKRVLGWEPRSQRESLVASAESLERFGLLRS